MELIFKFFQGKIPEKIINDPVSNQNLQTGAKAAFKGCVRNDVIHGNTVNSIEFTAHETIAETSCKELMKKTSEKYGLHRIIIYHSLGLVNAGETCFYVEVHSGHRKESFLALPELVDLFKSQIPIFGKELIKNGKSYWKENKY